ncbi:hypothetical protein JCM21714_90 [Gracilibacillus boraciitolerans JCM 21714]|uniref:Uncharacterized protein n=1 Tax=Gracilibacillus boraciitolerans JCM 21714 TaxID=1298598 RepID=W4VD74_9BACI|nr:hypothetical protein JCM21714_90 [Gracilibacillus boraciitolerans JCM 21714]
MQDLFGFIIPILAVVFWLFGLKKTNEEENKQQSSSSQLSKELSLWERLPQPRHKQLIISQWRQ